MKQVKTLAGELLRAPLFQFLFLGFVAWLLLGWLSTGEGELDKNIIVDREKIDEISARFSQAMMRPPSAQELESLVEQHIREEIYLREGLALGLDQDDPVIRKRIYSKMDFLLRAELEAMQPTDQQLREMLLQQPARYQRPAQVSFEQVWLAQGADAQELLQRLQAGDRDIPARSALLPAKLEAATFSAVDRVFGSGFAAQIAGLPLQQWAGPVSSGYGEHLVMITSLTAAQPASLEDARDQLLNDWRARQRERLDAQTLLALKKKYRIEVAPAL